MRVIRGEEEATGREDGDRHGADGKFMVLRLEVLCGKFGGHRRNLEVSVLQVFLLAEG